MSLESPEYSVSEHSIKATAPVINILKRLHYIAHFSDVPKEFFLFNLDQSTKLFAFKHLENDSITFFMPRQSVSRDRRAEQLHFGIRYGRSYFLQLKDDKLLIPQSLNEFIERIFGRNTRFLEQFIPAIENKGIILNKKISIKVIDSEDIFFPNINNVQSSLELYFLTEFNNKNVLKAKFDSNEIHRLKEINRELKNFKFSVTPINNDDDFNLPSSKEIAITRYNGFVHLGYRFKGDADKIDIQLIENFDRIFDTRQSLENEIIKIFSTYSQEITNGYKPSQNLDKEKFMELVGELYNIRNNFSKRCQEQIAKETQNALYELNLLIQKYQDDVVI